MLVKKKLVSIKRRRFWKHLITLAYSLQVSPIKFVKAMLC